MEAAAATLTKARVTKFEGLVFRALSEHKGDALVDKLEKYMNSVTKKDPKIDLESASVGCPPCFLKELQRIMAGRKAAVASAPALLPPPSTSLSSSPAASKGSPKKSKDVSSAASVGSASSKTATGVVKKSKRS
jgi:hypothetical protein